MTWVGSIKSCRRGSTAYMGALYCLSWMLAWEQRSSGRVPATFQLKSPFAFFGLALATGNRGF